MTDLTNTAPKRIYLDIGDQFALERVASGDLRWDLLDGVTWSEDNATSHGIPYVRADLVPTPAASGAAPAEFEPWLRTICITAPPPQAYDLAKQAWAQGMKRGAALASREAGKDWSDTEQSALNDWFMALPEGRRKTLLEGDRWMLAGAAFVAGRAALASPQVAPEIDPRGADYRKGFGISSTSWEQDGWKVEVKCTDEGIFLPAIELSMTRIEDDATPVKVAPTATPTAPVAWQERQQTRTGWTEWYEAKEATALLFAPTFRNASSGIEYQWRPLYAAPVAPQPIGYAVERSAFRVSPDGQDAESREWLEFTDDPKEKGAFAVYATPVQVAPPNLSSPLAGDCRTVGGFLSDVMTAAGLVEHGRQCKPLAERISVACSDLMARIFQGSAPVAPQDDARDAALWREHVAKLDALVTYCPTCCQGYFASKEMTRDEIIFECGKTVGRSTPAAKPTEEQQA